MNTLKKTTLLAAMLLTGFWLHAQGEPATMADTMRSNGRIYVVVAVVLTILAGLIFYLIRLDRKISRFEKD